MIPQIVDKKYQIVRQLGEGGMGAVYEARHLGTRRRVALKVIVASALGKDADIVTRFQREVRASGAIESEHVVQVFDAGVDADTQNPYMVMELLNGEDVQQLIGRLGPLEPDLALRILAQASHGLARAHEAGIIHRDIKSANIFLANRDSGDAIAKLLDFGIAKVRVDQLTQASDHGLTRTGSMMGSPLYMSPEQALGLKTLDGRSDIYSLGVVLYEALCGTPPRTDCESLGQLLLAVTSGRFQPVQDVAPWVRSEVASIVHKAMAQEPVDRFQTAAEMHEAIVAQLPNGSIILQSLLVPMQATTKAVVAPRAQTNPASPPGGSSPVMASIVAPVSGRSLPGTGGSTTAGFGASGEPLPAGVPGAASRSAVRWLAPLALALLIGGGGAVYALRSKATEPPAMSSSSPSTTASIVPAPVAPSSTPRTVQVGISPPEATVEVDSVAASVSGGMVTIAGDIGSVHHVHVHQKNHDKTVDVVIAETGPVPSTVSVLQDPVSVTRPATSRPSRSAPPTATTPTPPPASTPKKTSTTPSAAREM